MAQIDIRKHLAYLNEKYGVEMETDDVSDDTTRSEICISSAASYSQLWLEHIVLWHGSPNAIRMANRASAVVGLSSVLTHRRGSIPITTLKTIGICLTVRKLSGHQNGTDIHQRM